MIFSKVTYHNNLGTTPARVNRRTGELQINTPVWERLSPEAKRFVLLHEEGHLVLQTRNELAADKYAFSKYAGEGLSLKAGVKALTEVLSDKPAHLIRSQKILAQAAQFDKTKNGNMETGKIFITEPWENFLGFGKKAKARKEARQERREERKELKLQKKFDKNQRKNTLAEARAQQKVMLAQTGQSAGGQLAAGLGNAIGNLGSTFANVATGGLSGVLGGAAANVLPSGAPSTNLPTYSPGELAMGGGGGGGNSFQQSYESEAEPVGDFSIKDPSTYSAALKGENKNKSLPWIIGGALAVVVVLALIMRKK